MQKPTEAKPQGEANHDHHEHEPSGNWKFTAPDRKGTDRRQRPGPDQAIGAGPQRSVHRISGGHEPAKATGEVGECRELLFGFLGRQGIELEYNEAIAPAQGVSFGGRIALLPGQSPAEELATLIHEAGHELLHRGDRRAATTKAVRELEAEAVAFVIGQAIGLTMGTTSADYIKLYNGDAAMLAASLEAIQNASAVLLAAILPETEREDTQKFAAAC